MKTLGRAALALLVTSAAIPIALSCARREVGPSRGAAGPTRAKSAGRATGSELVRLVPLPPRSQPHGIVTASDGSIWCSLWNRGVLARVAAEEPSTVTEIALPPSCGQPDGLAPGPEGTIWCITAGGYRIVRVAAGEPYGPQVFERLGDSRGLYGIAAGPDGLLWMAGARRLVRMRASVPPEYEEYPFAYSKASALGVAVDAAGDIWFTRTDGAIGRARARSPLAPEIFPLPDPKSDPQGIAVGPDGAVWFTELAGNVIGRLDPERNAIQEFTLPTPNARPREIVRGPDDALWFTESGAGKVGRIAAREPFGIAEFAVPAQASRPWGVAAGPDGNVWFTDGGADAVGRIALAVAGERIRASEGGTRVPGGGVRTTGVQPTGSAGRSNAELVVTADADCTVSIDGAELFKSVKGHTRTFAIAPGWHVVSASAAEGGRRLTRAVEAVAGRTTYVSFDGLAPAAGSAKTTQPPRR